ncbi:retrovirus-related Pol polyprotein from transposon TNT 1-94, partial [Trifolium medium]|nr:retrovirus-related Pol polyprotein from transposon TNT 1-94 [Trifolium medium]
KKKGKGKAHWSNNGKAKTDDKTESSKRGGFIKSHNKKKNFDKSKVQSYNCEKFGHFADECWFKKDQQNGEEANIVQGNDPNAVLMMATTCDDSVKNEEWYLDSGCSNHMTAHREWLTSFDTSKKTSIKLANSRKLATEGTGNIVVRRQLVEKGFSMTIEGDSLRLFDTKKNLVLKSTLSKNRTYKCNISSDKMMCMSTIVSEDTEALWHKRYRHLNFRSLSDLNAKELVNGLPKINVSNEICEVSVKSKQNRLSFVSDLPKRASVTVQVIHSDICGPFKIPSLGGKKLRKKDWTKQGSL